MSGISRTRWQTEARYWKDGKSGLFQKKIDSTRVVVKLLAPEREGSFSKEDGWRGQNKPRDGAGLLRVVLPGRDDDMTLRLMITSLSILASTLRIGNFDELIK